MNIHYSKSYEFIEPFLCAFYQGIKIALQRKITLIIHEIINGPGFGGVDTREIFKTKTFGQQLGFAGFCFIGGVQFS